jgi:hypothetical protein
MTEGTATWTDDLDDIRRWATRIGARNGVPGELLVRVTPAHVVAVRDVAE